MKRLFFFCAEYARRHPRPVQAIGASNSVHILGFALQTVDEDFEKTVRELHENGLRETQERPEEWTYVTTTYREVERDEMEMMYRAVAGEKEAGGDRMRGKPHEVFPDSYGPNGEPLFGGRPGTMTTPVKRLPGSDGDDDSSVA